MGPRRRHLGPGAADAGLSDCRAPRPAPRVPSRAGTHRPSPRPLIVLADNVKALFRNVPPPLSLALAMTEKHEKAERAAIMRERGCSELEAVDAVAERIAAIRN